MTDYNTVEVVVFATRKEYRSYDMQDEPRIANAIHYNVLPAIGVDYYRVDVKIKRKDDQTPDYLIAYMLRKDTWTADVVKVEIDENYNVLGIIEKYDDSAEEDEDAEEEYEEELEYGAYDFIVSTPASNIPTAVAAVNAIYNQVKSAGLKPRKLLGSSARLAYYKYYLKSGLKGFVNIGHGYPGGIVLHDGTLRSTWFQGLPGRPLNPAVVYFNSCQVFNDPLKSAVMKAGARTYIGGITNLLIGPSEKVCKCFWNSNTLRSLKCMASTLSQCEQTKYPSRGAHGITGDRGPFPRSAWHYNKSVVRTHAKNGTQNTWAIIDGSCWLSIRPQSADGVTNVFMILCEALANNRKVDVYVHNGRITQATLR